MYTQNSNRAWKRNLAKMNTCNRAARRNAARILATLQPTGPAPTDTAPSLATVQRVYNRPYVAINPEGFRVMFRCSFVPDGYTSVMGPFKTSRAAQYALNDASCPSVAVAERDSKLVA